MKLVKNFRYFFVCFFVIITEACAGKYLAISGTVPMLSFCLCLAVGAHEENLNYIITIGIVMGALLDLIANHGFGLYTITFMLSSWVTYLLRDSVFSSKTLFLICDVLVLSILFCIIYYLFNILNVGINFAVMLTNIAFPTAIYNTFLCVAFYWMLYPIMYKRR